MTDGHGLSDLLRPPTRRGAVRGAGTAFLVSAVCWYFGVNVWHAILLGCALTAAVLAVMNGASTHEFREIGWRHRRRNTGGSRSEVESLASSLRTGWEPVGLTAERRLRQIARHRLALEGLDLQSDDQRAAIESRIGTRAYRILRDSGKRPRLGSLIRCLDALDALSPDHYQPPRPRSRVIPNLIPSNLRRTRER